MSTQRRAMLLMVAATSAASCASARALAQEPAEPPPATAPTEPAPTPDPVADEARARYRRGIELFDDGDYRLALVELERAYAILPSYKVLYNIGQVHFQLNEYAKAQAALTRYLADGKDDIPPERRAEVERDLATLRGRVATLSVRSNVSGAEVTINGEPVGRAPVERLVVDAGVVRVQVSGPGYSSQTRVIKLAGGDGGEVRVDLVKTTPELVVSREGLPGVAIAGWITTGILAAGAVGVGIAANAALSSYDTSRAAPIQGSPEEAAAALERQRDLVTGLAITTDVLSVAAIAAAGVSLYFTLRGNPKADTPRVRVQGNGGALSVGF